MEYRIEDGPVYQMAGISIDVNYKDGGNLVSIPSFWDRSWANGHCQMLKAKAKSPLGLCGVHRDLDIITGKMVYSIAIIKPASMVGMPVKTELFSIPACTWGKFTSRGPLRENFPPMVKRIFDEWFPHSDWKHASGPEVEFYPDMNAMAPDYWCEYWVPLMKYD